MNVLAADDASAIPVSRCGRLDLEPRVRPTTAHVPPALTFRHGSLDGGGNVIVARIQRGRCVLTPEDAEHVRDLAFAALAQESTFLARHAEDAWAGEHARGEDAETVSEQIRRTFSVLDAIGWRIG